MKDLENNPFDDKIKQSLEGFEMPYDPAAWNAIESQLPNAGGAVQGSGINWKGIAAVTVVAGGIITALLLMNRDGDVSNQITETDKVENVVPQPAEKVDTEVESQVKLSEVEKPTAVEESTTPTGNTATNRVDENATSVPEKVEESGTAAKQTKENQPEVAVTDNGLKPRTPEDRSKPFEARFIASSTSVCAGDDVAFINNSSDRSANMVWDFGDGSTSNESDPVHSYIMPGVYTVTLQGNRKGESDEEVTTVRVNPAPSPMLSVDPLYEAIPLYKFRTAVQPNEMAIWSFSDGSKVTGTSAEHLFRSEGTGNAQLTVKNQHGCATSIDREFSIREDFALLAPNTFTPNGDGINETFIPIALTTMGKAFTMTIQNPRTGELVFETSNPESGWNGSKNNQGTKLENGVYVWTVVIEENIVDNRVFNGKIKLQR